MTVMGPWEDLPRQDRAEYDPTVALVKPKRAAITHEEDDLRMIQFSDFYRAQVPRLTTFLRWQGASVVEAADIAQDTMIKAFRRWMDLTNPPAWIRTVASRELIRHKVDANTEVLVDAPPEQSPALLRFDADLDALEERHEVLKLLALLPLRQRQVLAWTYDGFSPTEIAHEVGGDLTPEAVRASLKKARRALAEHLGRTGHE